MSRGHANTRESFYDSFIPEPNSGCWLWTMSYSKKGYGRTCYKSKLIQAHRLSWIFSNGDIPEGMFVCHKCDTPSCGNPDHLFLGSAKENTADMMKKGRSRNGERPWGMRNINSTLTTAQVEKIREDRRILREIAKDYGVSISCVHSIRAGKSRATG